MNRGRANVADAIPHRQGYFRLVGHVFDKAVLASIDDTLVRAVRPKEAEAVRAPSAFAEGRGAFGVASETEPKKSLGENIGIIVSR